MKKILFPLVAISLLVLSCAKEPLAEEENTSEGLSPKELPAAEPALVKGVREVLFSDEMIDLVEADLAKGSLATKSMQLNEALTEMGITAIERIFPYAGEFEARHREAGLHKWYRIYYNEDVPQTKAASTLLSIPGVEVSNPVCYRSLDISFDDPREKEQWGFHNNVKDADVNVEAVWNNYTTGREDVIVSVVDTGVQLEHPDLKDNTIPAGEDGSHSFMNGGNENRVVAGDHGTHVAGTIAAINNNGTGVCGLAGGNAKTGAKGVKIMSCVIFQAGLSGANDHAAIVWGADHGAVISQNSWGYNFERPDGSYDTQSAKAMHDFYMKPNSGEYRDAIKDAVDYFNKYAGMSNGKQTGPMAGGVVIFAAGNENQPYGAPGCYEGCISVGSITRDGSRSSFSNYGSWVDICAPGSQIVSTLTGGGYGTMSGTSMACPHVSGVAALVVSYCGGKGFTAEALREKLIGGARSISGLSTGQRGIGPLVDALGAIEFGSGEAPSPVESYSPEIVSNNVDFSITVTGKGEDNAPAYGFRLLASKDKAALQAADPSKPASGISYEDILNTDIPVGGKINGTLSGLDFENTYYIAVSAFDYGRNFSPISSIEEVTTGINHAPDIAYDIPGGRIEIPSFKTVSLPFTAIDPDRHAVKVSVSGGSAAVSMVEKNNSYSLNIKGNGAPAGTYTCKITATDSYNLASSSSFTYTLLPNSDPVVKGSIPDILLSGSGDVFSFNIEDYIYDPDGETIKYSIVNNNPSAVHVKQNGNIFYVTAMSDAGAAIVRISGHDSGNNPLQLKDEFNVLVREESVKIVCYPNPVLSDLFIATGGNEEEASIKIVSSSGATVISTSAVCSAFNPAKIDMRGCGSGKYSVTVKYGGGTYTQTIIKR